MTTYVQKKLEFTDNIPCAYKSPNGYKGLSGFHKYWGKKPAEAWQYLIENLTEPNDVILDPFLGSGLVAKECTDRKRRFIGFDVNPISIELTSLYLQLPNYLALKNAFNRVESNLKATINEMYLLSNGTVATHFLWDKNCITKVWTKKGRKRLELHLDKTELHQLQCNTVYQPKNLRTMRLFDNSRINAKHSFSLSDLFTSRALRAIDLLRGEIDDYDNDVKRALLLTLSSALGQMSKMVFAVSKRGKTQGKKFNRIEVGSWVIGYWRPEQHFEINAWNCYENKARKLLKAVQEIDRQPNSGLSPSLTNFFNNQGDAYITVGDSEALLKQIPTNHVKVVLTDPPHGDRIPYLELSEMWNSVIGLESNYADELVVSNAKVRNKNIGAYSKKLTAILHECARVLDDNGLLAVMFNAKSEKLWDSLNQLEQSSELEYIGHYPMQYSAGSVVQDNREGSLKTDFILLYGKNISSNLKSTTLSRFGLINNWSTDYPRKI